MSRPFDLSVYLVTDARLCAGRGLLETVRASAQGGATIVQLRDPDAPARRLVAEARALIALLRPQGIPLIVNDRADVAVAADADGVHIGQKDLSARDVRKIVGPKKIVGLSVGSPAEFAASAEDLPFVDYLGVGPVRATATKADAGTAIGIGGVRAVQALTRLPVVAIAGIDAALAGELIRAGADGVAVVSAICAAADPRAATRAIAEAVATARRQEGPARDHENVIPAP
jgi:thiamine-phosphate pyrophosphorylase